MADDNEEAIGIEGAGGEEAEDAEEYDDGPSMMKELIEYIAKSLVENPDDVVITEEWDGHRHVIHLDVAEGDMGKVIGRGGRVAEAMRSLLKVVAVKEDTRAVLDIGD